MGQRTAKRWPQSWNWTPGHFESHVSLGSKPWTRLGAMWSGNEAGPLAQIETDNGVWEEAAGVVANSAEQQKRPLVSGLVLQNGNEAIVRLLQRRPLSCWLEILSGLWKLALKIEKTAMTQNVMFKTSTLSLICTECIPTYLVSIYMHSMRQWDLSPQQVGAKKRMNCIL